MPNSRRNGSSRHYRKLRDQVLRDAGWQCEYCGAPATEVDHVVPVAKGGVDSLDNLVASCRQCNNKKSAKPLTVFLAAQNTPPSITGYLSPTARVRLRSPFMAPLED